MTEMCEKTLNFGRNLDRGPSIRGCSCSHIIYAITPPLKDRWLNGLNNNNNNNNNCLSSISFSHLGGLMVAKWLNGKELYRSGEW